MDRLGTSCKVSKVVNVLIHQNNATVPLSLLNQHDYGCHDCDVWSVVPFFYTCHLSVPVQHVRWWPMLEQSALHALSVSLESSVPTPFDQNRKRRTRSRRSVHEPALPYWEAQWQTKGKSSNKTSFLKWLRWYSSSQDCGLKSVPDFACWVIFQYLIRVLMTSPRENVTSLDLFLPLHDKFAEEFYGYWRDDCFGHRISLSLVHQGWMLSSTHNS